MFSESARTGRQSMTQHAGLVFESLPAFLGAIIFWWVRLIQKTYRNVRLSDFSRSPRSWDRNMFGLVLGILGVTTFTTIVIAIIMWIWWWFLIAGLIVYVVELGAAGAWNSAHVARSSN